MLISINIIREGQVLPNVDPLIRN